jgi:hypothetical protein
LQRNSSYAPEWPQLAGRGSSPRSAPSAGNARSARGYPVCMPPDGTPGTSTQPGTAATADQQAADQQAADQHRLVARLLHQHGTSYADEAGIRLRDQPAPLFQLLVLALLLSARISASVATAAARELFDAGFTDATAMAEATWQARVDALGRGHYRRYDERTSTMLGQTAGQCLDRWNGDLRGLHRACGDDPGALARALTEFPGIGPAGAGIYLREVQAVWPGLPPMADDRVREGARRVGLPEDAEALAALAGKDRRANLSAALVRVALGASLADDGSEGL